MCVCVYTYICTYIHVIFFYPLLCQWTLFCLDWSSCQTFQCPLCHCSQIKTDPGTCNMGLTDESVLSWEQLEA